MERVDVTIIGAGVIGLAVAEALSGSGSDIVVLDRNDSFGRETSSRNSEVIHAGLYYPKGSLKSVTCIEGRRLLYDFCKKNNVPFKKCGKIIAAREDKEIKKLEEIFQNARTCGVKNLEFLDKNEIKELEPAVLVKKGIFSPDTGIIDSHAFMNTLFKKAKSKGVNFVFSVEAKEIKKLEKEYEVSVKEPKGDFFSFRSKVVINCAGLSADEISPVQYKIHYCKGQYFRLRAAKKFSITHLIYPPPTDVDLGIHLTPDMAGEVRLGPDAEYVKEIDYAIDEGKRENFLASAKKLIPSIDVNDLVPDTSGIRPKLQAPGEGFRDFIIQEESDKGYPNLINLIGIESPGLTACLSIAERVKNLIKKDE